MQNQIIEMRKVARQMPPTPGVYLMRDRLGHVIYVGKAKNLRKRVSSYFQGSRKFIWAQPKIGAMVEMVREISFVETKNETEALLLEGKLIKEYKPRYNTDFTDDKQFLLVRVDLQNPLPKFRLCRNKKEDGADYYGPFAQAGMLRSTLSETTVDQYQIRVEEACAFLEGKAKSWLSELREEMKKKAISMEFERAAELRDITVALSKTIGRSRRFSRKIPVLENNEWKALERLGEALDLLRPPSTIECFDVSHVSGTFVVASMVRFVSGRPEKRSYRRFKIRAFEGNDDFRAMEEVIGRRYSRLNDNGKEFPELIIVDGGMGQVSAAIKAFLTMDVQTPPLVGLAKREETVVFPDKRDEAHRFANQFNADLRSRKIRESVLDDFSGLGKVRRQSLFNHFGTLEKMRQANELEIQEVEGFGFKIAKKLHAFLKLKNTVQDNEIK